MSANPSNFATQCPHCGTIFQMQLPQLRNHGHQVRCGRCYAVFSAIQNLTDYPQEAPRDTLEHDAAAGPQVNAGENLSNKIFQKNSFSVNGMVEDETTFFNSAQLELPMMHDQPDIEIPFFTPEIAHPTPRAMPPVNAFRPSESPEAYEARNDLFADEQVEYRQQKISEKKHFERVKQIFALLFVGLTILLFAGQTLYFYRNNLVQMWPSTRGVVMSFCRTLGCDLGPPRNIDALRLSQSRLGQVPYRSGQLFLEVQIHNRAKHAIAVPYLELSLKDSRGQVVARKVFAAPQLLPPEDIEAGLGANTITSVRATFLVGDIESSGYSVALFYP